MNEKRFIRRVVAPGLDTYKNVLITAAQVLALNATPRTLVPSPGPGRFLVFKGMHIHKIAGTAFAAIAAGEDLAVKYTDANGQIVATCETTGFLDSAGAQTRQVHPHTPASGSSSVTPADAAPLVLHLLSGEITTGTTPLRIQIFYKVVPVLPGS
jgi:hypothetical protein